MIHVEKKILKILTKLSGSTSDSIFCDEDRSTFTIVHDANEPVRSASFACDDIRSVLRRLSSYGYITVSDHPTEIYFSLTYEAIHRFQYSFDRFRTAFFSRFVYGLITGIITGAASTLLAQYLLGLLFQAPGR